MAMSKLILKNLTFKRLVLVFGMSNLYQSLVKNNSKLSPKQPLAYMLKLLALSQSFPMLIDFQNVHNIHSLAIAATFEALINELKRRNTRVMVISNAAC